MKTIITKYLLCISTYNTFKIKFGWTLKRNLLPPLTYMNLNHFQLFGHCCNDDFYFSVFIHELYLILMFHLLKLSGSKSSLSIDTSLKL